MLCPNCHTQVHKGEIDKKELIKRKSTHCEGDRVAGSIPFKLKEAIVKVGSATFKNVPIHIIYNDEPIFILKEKNESFFLTTRFYDKFGALIFWMSSNRYWAPSHFSVEYNKKELVIINKNDENNYLRIWNNEGMLMIEGRSYLKGNLLDINSKYIKTGTATIENFNAANSPVGIAIEDQDFDINNSTKIKGILEKYNFIVHRNRKK